jgi:hypothetical protein
MAGIYEARLCDMALGGGGSLDTDGDCGHAVLRPTEWEGIAAPKANTYKEAWILTVMLNQLKKSA